MESGPEILVIGVSERVNTLAKVLGKTKYNHPLMFIIQADLGDTVGLVPDHRYKADITIKQVTRIFWLSSAYKSYIYTIL